MERFNPQEIEKKVSSYWEENSIYEKVKKLHEADERFYFNDGPPYTTGSIHLGTAWNKVLKDSFLRYKRMQGYNVHDQPGFDMHGLPIEVKVEENLGIKNKKEIIEKIGMDNFIEKCKAFALKNLDMMAEQFKKLGVWMDWKHPYRTLDNSYIEGAWWSLKKAHENGLLYQGPKVVTWCPRCATALAKHELDYKTVSENSVFVKFKIEGKENEYVLIWTTTPWTLPSNMFVAVHPDLDYVRVQVEDEVWILAKGLVHALLGVIGKKYHIIEEFKGTKLHGLRYVHPFLEEVPKQKEFRSEIENAHRILTVGDDIFPDFVTLSAGSGCVHCAPGTGPEDFEVGKHYNIPAFCPVDENGIFTKDAGKYIGLRAKKDDGKIINDLKEKGLLVFESKVEHEYPHCWRCKSPVIFRATDQWYLGVSKLKDKLIEENKNVKWVPEWAGSKWFRDWLENLQDWCISRQRFWGIPLPIWKCKNGHIKVIGSREELGQEVKDLHRPWIDQVKLKCDVCGEEMQRVPDILDVWLDSGAAIWASLGFPKNKEEFDKWWPADFITEGKDQIRGWFNSLMCLSVASHGISPYKSVYMHGFVADEKGMKMSKSVGNIVSPEEVIKKVGADGWRLYCLAAANPGEDLKFNWKDLDESYRALNTLWNTFQFSKYMELEDFNPEEFSLDPEKLKPEDKWILSRINTLTQDITHAFESYMFPEIPEKLRVFLVEDLSRWYIKLIRNRTWVSAKGEDKLIAFKVLYDVLKRFLLLAVPIIPYHTEEIYQNLVRKFEKESKESIHMYKWPVPDENLIHPEIEKYMAIARSIIESSRFAREEAKIKLRWPLNELAVDGDDEVKQALETFNEIIKEQANVKKLTFGNSKGVEKEFGFGKLYLDTEITQEIREEAMAREVMRAVQVLRKKNNFKVTDKISLNVSSKDSSIVDALQKFRKEIAEKVGAKDLNISSEESKGEFKGSLNFEGKDIIISFNKV